MSPSAFLRALRPRQWSKNVFVLAALFFAYGDRSAVDSIGRDDIVRTLWAFVAFCLVSSAVYFFNGVLDVASDRAHPEKKKRPIAAGEISVPAAYLSALVLALASLAIGWWVGGEPFSAVWLLAAYLLVNLGYSLGLKRVVLLDAFCIASGFVLRVAVGGLAAGAEVSHWLFLCTLFLALFLALNKRRAEMLLLGDESVEHRANLRDYTPAFLDQMVGVLAACTILCYTMYTVDDETAAKFGEENHLFWTVPFVAFGIGRYMILVQSARGGGNPARILLGGDALFLLNSLAWLAVVGWAILG